MDATSELSVRDRAIALALHDAEARRDRACAQCRAAMNDIHRLLGVTPALVPHEGRLHEGVRVYEKREFGHQAT
jgi:hypothetical protein